VQILPKSQLELGKAEAKAKVATKARQVASQAGGLSSIESCDPCGSSRYRDTDLNLNLSFYYYSESESESFAIGRDLPLPFPVCHALNWIQFNSIENEIRFVAFGALRRRSINYFRTLPQWSSQFQDLVVLRLIRILLYPIHRNDLLLVVSRFGHRQHPAARSHPHACTWSVQWARSEWQRMSWRSIEFSAKENSLPYRVSIPIWDYLFYIFSR